MIFHVLLIIFMIIILFFLLYLNKKREGFNNIKILVIICSHKFNKEDCENIKILNDYLLKIPNVKVDYCGITNDNDFFSIFEHIITFKYKVINQTLQLSKVCDFISANKSTFDYNYFIKIRPEIKLLEEINFDNIDVNCICARAREYKGPEKIKYGMVADIKDLNLSDTTYSEHEEQIILDDQIYIFSNKIVNMGAFDNLPKEYEITVQNEYLHTKVFNERKIPLKVIGINCFFTKYGVHSGNLNL